MIHFLRCKIMFATECTITAFLLDLHFLIVLMLFKHQFINIVNKIGKDNFDKMFKNKFSQLIITKWLYQPFTSENKIDNPLGNPLFSIFDVISDLSIDNLQDGDIIYMKGVDDYTKNIYLVCSWLEFSGCKEEGTLLNLLDLDRTLFQLDH